MRRPGRTLSEEQERAVVARAGSTLTTVRRWSRGIDVRAATRVRIERACADLGIEVPIHYGRSGRVMGALATREP